MPAALVCRAVRRHVRRPARRRARTTARRSRSPTSASQVARQPRARRGVPGRPAHGRGGRRASCAPTRSSPQRSWRARPDAVAPRHRRADDRPRALERGRDPGGAGPPLVDARPGGRHQGLPARRAVRGRARAHRGWRAVVLAVLGCPNLPTRDRSARASGACSWPSATAAPGSCRSTMRGARRRRHPGRRRPGR